MNKIEGLQTEAMVFVILSNLFFTATSTREHLRGAGRLGFGEKCWVCKCRHSEDAGQRLNVVVVRSDSSSGKITSRSYKFIDKITSGKIAQPSSQYSRLLQFLPRNFVGSSEDVKHFVRVTCNMTKRLLRSTDLFVPPVQVKWEPIDMTEKKVE
ncbi:uncharacterized protein [Pyrus communis]|uniref:uncharacterized protein n=1 Tax=Pyrus communis TaxID=23211 RepID=UPI0035BFC1D2